MIRNGALSHRTGLHDTADVSVTVNRSDFDRVILGQTRLADLINDATAKVEADTQALHDFIGLLDTFEFWFNIVTP